MKKYQFNYNNENNEIKKENFSLKEYIKNIEEKIKKMKIEKFIQNEEVQIEKES